MLDPLLGGGLDDSIDVNARCVDAVRVKIARGHDFFYLRHGDLTTDGHGWIEVPGGHAINEVA